MSAVQRTMHREYRGGSGCRPEEPWAFDRLPRRLRLRAMPEEEKNRRRGGVLV